MTPHEKLAALDPGTAAILAQLAQLLGPIGLQILVAWLLSLGKSTTAQFADMSK